MWSRLVWEEDQNLWGGSTNFWKIELGEKHVESEESGEYASVQTAGGASFSLLAFLQRSQAQKQAQKHELKQVDWKSKTYTIFLPSPYAEQQQPMVVICSPSKCVRETFSKKIEINWWGKVKLVGVRVDLASYFYGEEKRKKNEPL